MNTLLTIFLMSDQPTTCHYCRLRSEILADFMHTNCNFQIHYCHECKISFIEEDDEN